MPYYQQKYSVHFVIECKIQPNNRRIELLKDKKEDSVNIRLGKQLLIFEIYWTILCHLRIKVVSLQKIYENI